MRALALALLVACGGSPAAPVAPPKPVEAAIDPPCPTTTKFPLPGGKLRCRELPFTADFPPGIELERQDSENVTFIRANLDRGVLAVFAEPRFDAQDDATALGQRLEAFVKGIANDATISRTQPPPQAGATASVGLSFTTPDGGIGTIHGYLAHGWFIAVTAGGRLAETRARPDKPLGKAFLASLKLRPVTTKWEKREVFTNVPLEMPLDAWPVPVANGTVEKETRLFGSAAERVWIGARDLPESPKCEILTSVTDADVPGAIRTMFSKDDLQVTGSLAKLGTAALTANIDAPSGPMVLYLVCLDPRLVLITVTGKRPATELKTVLDRVVSTLPKR